MSVSKIFGREPVLGLNELFMQAQMFENTHPGVRKQLHDMFIRKPRDVFIVEFLQCFSAILAHPVMGGPKMDKMLKFVAVFFATYEDDVEDVVYATLKFIFQHHNRESHFIRFHCCRFITFFLNNLGESASVDERVFDQIRAALGKRLNDKNTKIRCEAATALKRLQTPSDEECPVIKAYLFYLERDPNTEVRIAILKNLVLTPKTLPFVVSRISDVSEAVKIEAYKSLCVLNPKKFSIKCRQKILTYGMNDECGAVKDYVLTRLIPSWYESVSEDFTSLLRLIHVETIDTDVLKRILFSLFEEESTETLIEKVSASQRNKLIAIDDLTIENVTFWYFVIYYLRQPKLEVDEDEIFKIVPELSRFTVYVRMVHSKFAENKETMQYILIHLFKISALYSMDDEVGREKLRDLCCSVLTDKDITLKCIPDIVKNLEKAVPTNEHLQSLVAEIVSEIREPLCANTESVEMPQNDDVVCGESEATVFENTQQALVGNSDPETVIKCLTIVLNVVKSKAIGKISETLLSLKDNFVMKCFEILNDEVQTLAQEVLTVFCIWDVNIAKTNILKFFFLMSSEATRIPALKSLFDNFLAHGLHSFVSTFSVPSRPSEGDGIFDDFGGPEWRDEKTLPPSLRPMFHTLTGFLESENPEVRSIVSQGFAKLFLAGVLESPVIFAKLNTFWFSPSAAKGHDMRLPLGLFYQWFSTKSPKAGPIILDSFLLTLRFVDNYNSKNVEDEIDLMSVASGLIELIAPDNCIPPPDLKKTGSYHIQLACIIAKELVKVCNHSVLTKALSYLVFPSEDGPHLKELLNLLSPVVKRLATYRDKRLLNTLMTFKSRVAERNAKYIEENKEEDVDSQVDQLECRAEAPSETVERVRENFETMDVAVEEREDSPEKKEDRLEHLVEDVDDHGEEQEEQEKVVEENTETIESEHEKTGAEKSLATNNTVVEETLDEVNGDEEDEVEVSVIEESLTETTGASKLPSSQTSLMTSDNFSPRITRSRRK